MRCHYEVLEVARDASSDDIKKAYKKLALRWHPDKNIGNEEEATERFKEISQAFNVLSDPQERQWYDDHREDILRGGDGTGGTDEVIINIWPYFSSTCFDGFEGPSGFYAVYGDLFRRLHELEQSRCSKNHSDHPVVNFGDETIEESDLRRFYNHWENFVSCMNFSWADKYMPNEAPNRAYRRAMDAENKKARDKARKEWQDSVQALARHVRKRDRRMMRFESQRQEQLRQRKEEEAARKAREKAERKQALEEQRERWRQQAEEFEEERKGAFLLADEDEKEAAYLYGDDDDEEEDYLPARRAAADADEDADEVDDHEEEEEEQEEAGETQVFNCEICEKTFEKEEQYNQHINSRAHRAKKSELEKKAKKTKSQKPKTQQDETDAAGAAMAPKPIETDDEVAAMTELSLSEERPTNRKPKKTPTAAPAPSAGAAGSASGAASCRVCGESFSSRSKLFQHLEESGHATAIPVPVAAAMPETARRGKKGKKK